MAITERGKNAAKFVASKLFLHPSAVVGPLQYWMSGYTDFTRPAEYYQSDSGECYFQSLIEGLLENPVRLELTVSEGTADCVAKTVTNQVLIQFAGGPYHRIPSQLFWKNKRYNFITALNILQDPLEECFLQREDGEMDGKIHMASFRYNYLLEEAYEPGFLISFLYLAHMGGLVDSAISGCVGPEDWMERHTQSLKVLEKDSLEVLIRCFPKNKVRTEKLREELSQLRNLLDTDDIHKAIKACTLHYERRAKECHEKISEI